MLTASATPAVPLGSPRVGTTRGPATSARRVEGVDEELVGKIGEVVTRIEGGEEPGEVSLLVFGMRERYFALGREEIALGSKVLVIHDRGNRTVDVEPWIGL